MSNVQGSQASGAGPVMKPCDIVLIKLNSTGRSKGSAAKPITAAVRWCFRCQHVNDRYGDKPSTGVMTGTIHQIGIPVGVNGAAIKASSIGRDLAVVVWTPEDRLPVVHGRSPDDGVVRAQEGGPIGLNNDQAIQQAKQ